MRARRWVLLLSLCSFLFVDGRRSVDDLDHREVADVQVELLPADGCRSAHVSGFVSSGRSAASVASWMSVGLPLRHRYESVPPMVVMGR